MYVNIHIHTCMHIHMYVCTYAYIHVHTHIPTYMYVCMYVYTHTYICVYIYVYVYTYIHTYIPTRNFKLSSTRKFKESSEVSKTQAYMMASNVCHKQVHADMWFKHKQNKYKPDTQKDRDMATHMSACIPCKCAAIRATLTNCSCKTCVA